MTATETIKSRSGTKLTIETRAEEQQIEVRFRATSPKRCILHWGVRRSPRDTWRKPPEALWPPDTKPVGENAAQSPFTTSNGDAALVIRVPRPAPWNTLDFVLFFPEDNRWDNNEGRNYQVAIGEQKKAGSSPQATLLKLTENEQVTFTRNFDLNGEAQLAVAVIRDAEDYRVLLLCNLTGSVLLHWGLTRRSPADWQLPPESIRPANTEVFDQTAVQTPFVEREGLLMLELRLPMDDPPAGLGFVLKLAEPDGRWVKHRGDNFNVPIHTNRPQAGPLPDPQHAGIADEIIHFEMSRNSVTLMHRFNLCHDLLDQVQGNLEGYALLFVWLRFSATRQLTWQRNYNTKPRELAHAQDRLTQKMASLYRSDAAARPMLRLMFTTVGAGGEGQRIRDEILVIMHRHHIKEVSGHFLEEWHQKLHNNTTPDDVLICQAYLEFLRTNGSRERFYEVLRAAGVTRERLESFERPIRTEPDFVPHLKDALIHDFEHFLRILKASHSGTDFETAINAARHLLDGSMHGKLDFLFWHRNDPGVPALELISRVNEARRGLTGPIGHGNGLRELLYLDLALEQLQRGVIERNIHLDLGGPVLADLTARILESLLISSDSAELAACSSHWNRLQTLPRFDAAWSLHAKAVVDRIGRALSDWIDRLYQLLQPKAEYLGNGFQAEPWTITLFSEEVVRGGSLGFTLSMLLRRLDPLLRQSAQLGDWQIISRGHGAGRVEVVESLLAVQHARYDSPTVIVADKVTGEEEIPDGVTAVIAPDVTDVVSHVAVRARNAHLLFASCHESKTLQQLKLLKGKLVELEVNPSGDVIVKESAATSATTKERTFAIKPSLAARSFTRYVATLDEFDDKIVGGKSCHQAELRGKLPSEIQLPASVALPFGVFEHVLGLNLNRDVAARYSNLVQQLESSGEAQTLATLRETVLLLNAPEELKSKLRDAMNRGGLPWPDDWDKAWKRIKQVWASKWNDRAFLSRRKLGIPHDNLFMAVLIQQVVPADYAFVIHTVNPTNGNPDELFAEAVLGLGETLVGNHPGRALSFACNKKTSEQKLLSFPAKSTGLYGGGLIFRSDSNGEDLAGFAGAGLYESVLLDPPRAVELDYSKEPLVWDESFRSEFIRNVTRLGVDIERIMDAPQDIEGAMTQGRYHVVQTRPQVGIEPGR